MTGAQAWSLRRPRVLPCPQVSDLHGGERPPPQSAAFVRPSGGGVDWGQSGSRGMDASDSRVAPSWTFAGLWLSPLYGSSWLVREAQASVCLQEHGWGLCRAWGAGTGSCGGEINLGLTLPISGRALCLLRRHGRSGTYFCIYNCALAFVNRPPNCINLRLHRTWLCPCMFFWLEADELI